MVSDQVSSTHEEMRTEAFEREMAHLSEKEVLLRRIVKRKSANVGAPLDRTHQATQDTPETANNGTSSPMCWLLRFVWCQSLTTVRAQLRPPPRDTRLRCSITLYRSTSTSLRKKVRTPTTHARTHAV
jgi:hypothetical protein